MTTNLTATLIQKTLCLAQSHTSANELHMNISLLHNTKTSQSQSCSFLTSCWPFRYYLNVFIKTSLYQKQWCCYLLMTVCVLQFSRHTISLLFTSIHICPSHSDLFSPFFLTKCQGLILVIVCSDFSELALVSPPVWSSVWLIRSVLQLVHWVIEWTKNI